MKNGILDLSLSAAERQQKERARIAGAIIGTLQRINPVPGEATFVLLALVNQVAVDEGVDPVYAAALSLLQTTNGDIAAAIAAVDAVARRIEDGAADTEPAPAEPLVKLS